MFDKALSVPGANTLALASESSTDQALNGMHARPESLRDIASINELIFVKASDNVLLATSATRTVVDKIASQK
jgi:hypothetical protein